jgi:hypothetical protein
MVLAKFKLSPTAFEDNKWFDNATSTRNGGQGKL